MDNKTYEQYTASSDKPDKVNHPSHYTNGAIECINALEAATSNLKGIEAVCTANAIKYLWRWKRKNGVEDLEKAKWYIDHLIQHISEAYELENKYEALEPSKAVSV